MYFFTNSGCSLIASEIDMKIIPFSAKVSRKVVFTETESKTTSIATPDKRFCSSKEIPNFSKVFNNSGSTSSKLANSFLGFGAA